MKLCWDVDIFCRRYYKHQDALIASFEELIIDNDDDVRIADEQLETLRKAMIMAKVSFFTNLARTCIEAKRLGIIRIGFYLSKDR